MTTPRRFEQDLPALLGDLYVTGIPDYRDDLFRQTARTRQRPAWSFPGRWFPVDLVTQRVPTPRTPWRAIAALALIAVLIAAAVAVYVGSRPRLPAPFGIAANGALVYAADGEIYARRDLSAPAELLVGGSGDDHDPGFSPDGTKLLFIRTLDKLDYLMIAEADGADARPLVPDPLSSDAYLAWSPDSRAVALVNKVSTEPTLSLVPLDGGAAIPVDLGKVIPTDLAYRPPDGRRLLIRGQKPDQTIDFWVVDADGTGLHALGLPSHQNFGPAWDNSGPAWSLDGSTIAYNVVEKGDGTLTYGGTFRIREINADGSGDHAMPAPADMAVSEAWPLYSPDGRSILVHRWMWKAVPNAEGWLAIMPADGSRPARDVGPRIMGGEDTGLIKSWSPDGSRILMRARTTGETVSIDPVTGATEPLPWGATSLPDWQRRAP